MQELRYVYAKLAADEALQAFYEHFPRNQWWARENKECSTELIARARTAEELVREMQRTHLFSINSEAENRILAVNWLIAKYREEGLDVLAMPPEVQESPISYEPNCVMCGERRLSVDFFRSVSAAWRIRTLIQKERPPMRVVELGAGLGHLARALRIMNVSHSQVILDLPETLIFSYAFLTLSFPGARVLFVTTGNEAKQTRIDDYDFVFVPSCFAHLVDFEGAELFVNTASLGEMGNETIRYWMRFVHQSLPVKHLFAQNRFLNVIDPGEYSWRWKENESSLRFDATWTILGWDLEPTWFRCPYVVSISSRQLEIAATREEPMSKEAAENRGQALLAEVKAQDWLQRAGEPPYMNMRQNPFVTDVTMSGTLFRLWEAVRLCANDEAAYLMLRYLEALKHDSQNVFEETRYYEDLLLARVTQQSSQDVRSYAEDLRTRRSHEPERRTDAELVASTRDYNVVAVERWESAGAGRTGKIYLALSKAMGEIDVLAEKVGERDLPPMVLRAESVDQAVARARAMERPEVELMGSVGSFNLVRSESGYVAVARSLGPTNLFGECIGERDLAPVVFTAPSYEALCEKLLRAPHQAATERLDALETQLQTRASQADLAASAQAATGRLDALETQLQTRASQADLAASAQAATERLDALETQLHTQRASASERDSAQQAQIDEMRAMVTAVQSNLDTLSRQHQVIARQVAVLQYGPGEPQKPCVAGEHRGFTLVHYQGRVYGLRQPHDPSEIQLGERGLMALGDGQLISGHSVDGVRARIDVLEEARELQAELASLHQEFLVADSRLTESLRQAHAASENNTRDLERLAQRWPNRLFGKFSR